MPRQRIIETRDNPKPGPSRQWDWEATFDDWDEGDHIGYGATKEEAIADLLEQEGE